jgi:DNA-binding CsgD family transcriptional regulator
MGVTATALSFGALSEGQRECLRLVFLHYSSKEIARSLGVSPHTVDQRLRIAARKLNASSRFEAARMLSAVEGPSPYQDLIYQAPVIANDGDGISEGWPDGLGDARDGGRLVELHDSPSAFRVGPTLSFDGSFQVQSGSGLLQGSGFATKLAVITCVAILSLVAFGAAVAGLELLSRIT